MNSKQKISALTFVILSFLLTGCLDDLMPPPLTGELDISAKMLMYFEEQGDYINSDLIPLLVTAEELYNNINTYHIIDVRNNDVFRMGHIENAVNILNDSLFAYMEKIRDSSFRKIVIVSQSGQESSYYSVLLKLAGFDNVFSLNYGMASWHVHFAYDWLSALGNNSIGFVGVNFEKNDFTDLPVLPVDNIAVSIEEMVKTRVKMLLIKGYNFEDEYVKSIPNSIDNYLICYGNLNLYSRAAGHPEGTTFYLDTPYFDFRSTNYLQTLPTDRRIVIYSYNGQLSSSMVAYLKILGYNARSLLFGANHLFYSTMRNDPDLISLTFSQSEIMYYDYIVEE